MKKITALLLFLILLLTFAGCGGETTDTPSTIQEWELLIRDFEAWTHEYIAACDAYIANPTDMDAYNAMLALNDMAGQWDDKVAAMEAQLADSPEARDAFITEVNRIVQIMTDYSAKLAGVPADS